MFKFTYFQKNKRQKIDKINEEEGGGGRKEGRGVFNLINQSTEV